MTSTAWEELVAVAVVGTARREVPAGMGEGAGSAPERVLAAAAVLSAQRRAGWVPPQPARPAPPPAPEDARPRASDRALEVLGLLLSGELAVPGGANPLVAEWLRRAGSGWRLPAAWLPVVLDRATDHPALRPAARDVGGPPARWLAEHNPRWVWMSPPGAPPDPDAQWRLGTREERLAALTALRARTAARARTLLEATFAAETAADRAAFLAVLEQGLSAADEPLLEAALDDRAAGVREEAARLLDGLPTSARARRMAARALPLVTAAGGALAVRDPAAPDAAARRDGVRDAAEGSRKAAWLTQLVTATPLAAWSRHLGLPPASVAAGAPAAVLDGLVRAAVRQRDPEWAEVLLRVRPAATELLGVLRPQRAHALVAAHAAVATAQVLHAQLAALPDAWPRGLSQAVVARLAALGAGLALPPGMLPVLAARLDPGVDAAVLDWAAALPHGGLLRRAAHDLHHALTLRRVIADELP